MKVLILGAGVVGTTYAWQLSNAGYDTTLFVRTGKSECYKDGICIKCFDNRQKSPAIIEETYYPKVVEELGVNLEYDLIIITVRSNQLLPVLELIRDSKVRSDILFLQNSWDAGETIEQYISPSQYILGFPAVGGGYSEKGLFCILDKSTAMVLGEKEGIASQRLTNISDVFKKSGFSVAYSSQIENWLFGHYAWIASTGAAAIKAGSVSAFVASSELIRESWIMTKEGLSICKARGYEPKKEKANRIYYLPLFILATISKMMYNKETFINMFESNLKHSGDELVDMYGKLKKTGRELGIKTPLLDSYEKYIRQYAKRTGIEA